MKATSIQAVLLKGKPKPVPAAEPTPTLDTRLPLLTSDLPRLLNDPNRNPVYAGPIRAQRVYMRDFVVHAFSVLAVCNADDVLIESNVLDEFYTDRMAHIMFERSEQWTILTRNFKAIDAYNFNAELLRVRIHNKRDGLRRGYGPSTDHPNVLVPVPEAKRQARLIFCADCEEMYPTAYEVMDKLWKSVVFEQRCFLCLPCLEKRLERPLELTDFTNADINTGIRFGYNLAMKTMKELP